MMHIPKQTSQLKEAKINELKLKLINLINNSLKDILSIEINQFKQKIIQMLEEKFGEFTKNFFNKHSINKQNAYIQKSRAVSTISKKVIIIPNNYELEHFIIHDIQKEYKDITKKFEKIAMKLIKDNEKPKNYSLANFLKDVAYISRNSYNNSKIINENMKKEYLKIKQISENDFERKDFSIWVKKKEKYDKSVYNSYFQKEDSKDYLNELYNKLLILYFHCGLTFPPIEINFIVKKKEFDGDTMIDFLNLGKGEFQFSFFPSLSVNGDYLGKNTKLWVYTSLKGEASFNIRIINELNNLN